MLEGCLDVINSNIREDVQELLFAENDTNNSFEMLVSTKHQLPKAGPQSVVVDTHLGSRDAWFWAEEICCDTIGLHFWVRSRHVHFARVHAV